MAVRGGCEFGLRAAQINKKSIREVFVADVRQQHMQEQHIVQHWLLQEQLSIAALFPALCQDLLSWQRRRVFHEGVVLLQWHHLRILRGFDARRGQQNDAPCGSSRDAHSNFAPALT
jgi:hypothetical protein